MPRWRSRLGQVKADFRLCAGLGGITVRAPPPRERTEAGEPPGGSGRDGNSSWPRPPYPQALPVESRLDAHGVGAAAPFAARPAPPGGGAPPPPLDRRTADERSGRAKGDRTLRMSLTSDAERGIDREAKKSAKFSCPFGSECRKTASWRGFRQTRCAAVTNLRLSPGAAFLRFPCEFDAATPSALTVGQTLRTTRADGRRICGSECRSNL